MIAMDTDLRMTSTGWPMSSEGSGKESRMHRSLYILKNWPRKYLDKAEDKNTHPMQPERALGQEESLQTQGVTMLRR